MISEQDKKNFSEYVKNGNWGKAKMALYSIAGKPDSRTEELSEKIKSDFIHGVKVSSLQICATIIRQHPNVVVATEKQIAKIMQENKEKSKLTLTNDYFAKVSEPEPEESFEILEKPQDEMPELAQEKLDLLTDAMNENSPNMHITTQSVDKVADTSPQK